MDGKGMRLARIFSPQRRALIVPLDQALTSGPMPGLADVGSLLRRLSAGGPDAIIMHRGALTSGTWDPHNSPRFILHLSGNTEFDPAPHLKTLVASVEDAVRLGADGVSVHISLGTDDDRAALADLGAVSTACLSYGMPLLAMMYVYTAGRQDDADALAHAARIGAELGADAIKIRAPRDHSAFARIFDGCYVPVLVAGGEAQTTPLATLELIEEAMRSGGAGACVGRNVFQAQDPFRCARALRDVIHEGVPARSAYERWLSEGAPIEAGRV